jgi:hypothetical protein
MNRCGRTMRNSMLAILSLAVVVGFALQPIPAQASNSTPAAAKGFQCPWKDCRNCAHYQKACLGVTTPASRSSKSQQLDNHKPQSWLNQMTDTGSSLVVSGKGSITTGTNTGKNQSSLKADTRSQNTHAGHQLGDAVNIPANNAFGLLLAFLGFLLVAARHIRKVVSPQRSVQSRI